MSGPGVPKLQLVGGGRMGEALLGGLLAAGWGSPEDIRVVETSAPRRSELAARFGGVDLSSTIGPAEATVVATKPADVPHVVTQLAEVGGGRVLSIAAGVPIAQLEAGAADGTVVVRAMPNTAALVGRGASAIAAGTHATDADLDWAEGLLSAVGIVVRVPESQLDAVTGLSGSGPAYVFVVVEALIEAGVLAGLPRATASQLAVQTVLGAATLLDETGDSPEVLRAAVTSPGGTTAAGLRALEDHATRAAFIDAVMAATARSAELSR